jgi:glucose-6-phosphate 1-dehydrogenase
MANGIYDAPTQLLIFGGGGDLTRRKLIPALLRLTDKGQLGEHLQVIAIGRRDKTDEAFRAELEAALGDDLKAVWSSFAPRVFYRSADVQSVDSLRALLVAIDDIAHHEQVNRLCYLALKPSLFSSAVTLLRDTGIVERQTTKHAHSNRRVVIEKPFGHDLASARQLNDAVHRVLNEDQVFRIDHYLGKETVQNLLGLRFHNAIFEPLWNRHHVELVQITVAETVGVEAGRAGYYDTTGAVRDMLQNHMMQVLALVAMEPPTSLAPEAIRNQKVELLRAITEPDDEDVRRHSVRARYTAGQGAEGEPLIGYLDEEGVPEGSDTETYVAMRAEIDNWRWSGVPFLLRHGKRMPKRFTEVQVQFRTPPLQLFNKPEGVSDAELHRLIKDGALCLSRPNVLTIGIQPRETITLSFGVKEPGQQMNMAPASLTFDYRERFGEAPAQAYERLLHDALVGDATLFLRADEIEACWTFCDAVLGTWSKGEVPMHEYPAGSWGPDAANALFYGCEGGWTRG